MKLEFGGEGVPRTGGHDGCVGENAWVEWKKVEVSSA